MRNAGKQEKTDENKEFLCISCFPAFLLSSFINPPPSAPSDFLD
jgi:hypothetical protein